MSDSDGESEVILTGPTELSVGSDEQTISLTPDLITRLLVSLEHCNEQFTQLNTNFHRLELTQDSLVAQVTHIEGQFQMFLSADQSMPVNNSSRVRESRHNNTTVTNPDFVG